MLLYIGQVIIGLFFLVTGIYNMTTFSQQVKRLRDVPMPLPIAAMVVALVLQIGGAFCLMFNSFVVYGAIAEIIFTLLATILFQRFWSVKDDPFRRTIQFFFFVEHAAVIGALLMVIAVHSHSLV
jgi:uncharacterized membrane protein YphA (DoxX/SURF4 family)